jgi:micrococcal nuclease
MDTPESVKPGTPVQPLALAASAANKTLVGGKTVLLEKDVSETDRFGRLLRNVWVERDGRLVLVGLELVRTGYANVTTFPPDVKYVDQLLAALDEARVAGRGLWAPGATP